VKTEVNSDQQEPKVATCKIVDLLEESDIIYLTEKDNPEIVKTMSNNDNKKPPKLETRKASYVSYF
jgi:hypothetical protein